MQRSESNNEKLAGVLSPSARSSTLQVTDMSAYTDSRSERLNSRWSTVDSLRSNLQGVTTRVQPLPQRQRQCTMTAKSFTRAYMPKLTWGLPSAEGGQRFAACVLQCDIPGRQPFGLQHRQPG